MFVKEQAHDHFICSCDFHPEYRILLTGSVDKYAKIWKITNSTSQDLLDAFTDD